MREVARWPQHYLGQHSLGQHSLGQHYLGQHSLGQHYLAAREAARWPFLHDRTAKTAGTDVVELTAATFGTTVDDDDAHVFVAFYVRACARCGPRFARLSATNCWHWLLATDCWSTACCHCLLATDCVTDCWPLTAGHWLLALTVGQLTVGTAY